IIGELCAQLRHGVLALVRGLGAEEARRVVEEYHRQFDAARALGAGDGAAPENSIRASWHPEALEQIGEPGWQQLYVNAEHDGEIGIVTLGREAYNWDVDAELNRALDWLRAEGIERVILTGDFHLTTQLVGADTAEFFPALDDEAEGFRVSAAWSRTARRLHTDFRSSVGFLSGKRCLGGMLEL